MKWLLVLSVTILHNDGAFPARLMKCEVIQTSDNVHKQKQM